MRVSYSRFWTWHWHSSAGSFHFWLISTHVEVPMSRMPQSLKAGRIRTLLELRWNWRDYSEMWTFLLSRRISNQSLHNCDRRSAFSQKWIYADLQTQLPRVKYSHSKTFFCVLLIFTSRPRPTNLIKQPWTLHWRWRCAQWKEKINIDNDTLGVLSKAKGQTVRLAMILHVAEYCIKTATSPLDPTNSLLLQVGEESMTRVCVVMNHFINVKYIICPLAASTASPTGNADENLVKNERNVEHEKNRKNNYTYWVLFISFPCFTREWVFSSERKISRSIRTTDIAEDGRSWHWHTQWNNSPIYTITKDPNCSWKAVTTLAMTRAVTRGTQRPNFSEYARSISNGILCVLEACLLNLGCP